MFIRDLASTRTSVTIGLKWPAKCASAGYWEWENERMNSGWSGWFPWFRVVDHVGFPPSNYLRFPFAGEDRKRPLTSINSQRMCCLKLQISVGIIPKALEESWTKPLWITTHDDSPSWAYISYGEPSSIGAETSGGQGWKSEFVIRLIEVSWWNYWDRKQSVTNHDFSLDRSMGKSTGKPSYKL